MSDESWVTLATSNGYAVGALVLGQSLRAVRTTKRLHCMVTDGVSPHLREQLVSTFDSVTTVNVLDSEDTVNLRLIGRPDLGVTFTKIHCWRLTQYSKCVFLDADCLVLQNCDELFEHDEFSAVADIGWPDCFNSGVFVFKPSQQTYEAILNFAVENGTFDGGDQGLLNMFFHGWRDMPPEFRLPFIYNVTSGAIYTYTAALKKFGSQVKIVHFLGAHKPWHGEDRLGQANEYLSYWWSLYKNQVAPKFSGTHDVPERPEGAGVTSEVPGVSSYAQSDDSSPSDEERMRAWEIGHPDYMGRDSYDNIQKAIDDAMK